MISFRTDFIVAGSALFKSVVYVFHVVSPFLLNRKMEGMLLSSRKTTTWQLSGMSFEPNLISFRSLLLKPYREFSAPMYTMTVFSFTFRVSLGCGMSLSQDERSIETRTAKVVHSMQLSVFLMSLICLMCAKVGQINENTIVYM